MRAIGIVWCWTLAGLAALLVARSFKLRDSICLVLFAVLLYLAFHVYMDIWFPGPALLDVFG